MINGLCYIRFFIACIGILIAVPNVHAFELIYGRDGIILVKEDPDSLPFPLTTETLHGYLANTKNHPYISRTLKIPEAENENLMKWLLQFHAIPVTDKLLESYKNSSIKDNGACLKNSDIEFASLLKQGTLASAIRDQLTQKYSKVRPQCSINFYMTMLNSPALSKEKEFEKILWRAIEDHTTHISEVMDKAPVNGYDDIIDQLIKKNEECPKKCNSLTLNSVYESFLAKQVILSEKKNGGKNTSKIYVKIFDKLHQIYGEPEVEYENSWPTVATSTIYPVVQKASRKVDEIRESLRRRNDITIILDFFLGEYGFYRSPSTGSVQLPNGTLIERTLTHVQNDCYSQNILKARGARNSKTSVTPTNQAGIVKKLVIPALVFNPNDKAWEHSGAKVKIVKDSSEYAKNAKMAQIPLVCDISGTTNIALWSTLSLGIELNPKDLRFFLLSIWSLLCSDGGHSLQEVLSAAKLVSNYIAQNDLGKYLPKRTVDSLNEITKDLSADGSEPGLKFGRYYEGFFRNIETDFPDFAKMRQDAQREFNEYYKTSGCSN